MGNKPRLTGLIRLFFAELGNAPSIDELLDLCFVDFSLSWVLFQSAFCAAEHWHDCFSSGAFLARSRGVAYRNVSMTFTLSVRASRMLTASWSRRDRTASFSLRNGRTSSCQRRSTCW